MTHDQIAAALRVLGYKPAVIGNDCFYCLKPEGTDLDRIPLDLASLLRRCREHLDMGDVAFYYYPTGVTVVASKKDGGLLFRTGSAGKPSPDELTALILALAAMGEKESGNV